MRCRSVSRCRRGSSSRPALLQRLLTFTLPDGLLRARLRGRIKIDYIDLITEFSAHSINDGLPIPTDSHWNIAGNELAARLILQHVSAQLRPVDKSDVRFTPKNEHRPDGRLNSSGQDFIKILRGWSTNYPSWEFGPPSRRLREQTLSNRLRLINAAPRSRGSTPGQHCRSSTSRSYSADVRRKINSRSQQSTNFKVAHNSLLEHSTIILARDESQPTDRSCGCSSCHNAQQPAFCAIFGSSGFRPYV